MSLDGVHFCPVQRVGTARELAADGAFLVELQQAGGWRSPTTPAVYVAAGVRYTRAGRAPAVRGGAVGQLGLHVMALRPWPFRGRGQCSSLRITATGERLPRWPFRLPPAGAAGPPGRPP